MLMKYIDEHPIYDKRILLRVDFNVSLNPRHQIADDVRIRQSLPTIEFLLKHNNRLILISHLGRPHGLDLKLSLEPIKKRLQELLPDKTIYLLRDFSEQEKEILRNQKANEIILLENIRFFAEEDMNDEKFAKNLAQLADVYVNDAFAVSHRKAASIVAITQFLPSYAGLLLKKEVETLSKAINHPQKPFVVVLGGAKISTKIKLIKKLITLADFLLLGGGLANTFLLALGIEVGRSLTEPQEIDEAKSILKLAGEKQTKILLPEDVIIGDHQGKHTTYKKVQMLTKHDTIFDIGPETMALFGQAILQAKTIIWNGPVGRFETDAYRRGTDFIYYAIAANQSAISIVGGGETLAALSQKEHLEKITHISTGGAAMLEFIENGTLPGIEALKKCPF
jgi:phosphoglycerate kinase